MINFFGTIHLSGGCGPELLGALNLLHHKGVPTRCIVPEGDSIVDSRRSDFLRKRGTEVVAYRPGMFEKCEVLVSFGEEHCFDLMRRYADRPKYVAWTGGMSYALDVHVDAIRDGLVDESFFQTTACEMAIGQELTDKAGKPVSGRRNYCPYIDPDCVWFPLYPEQQAGEFNVLRATRDDSGKWDENHWRMAVGVSAPHGVPLQHTVLGWGENAMTKVGNPCDPSSRWNGLLDVALHQHITDPSQVAEFYRRSHVLLHYYPFVESFGYATAQAMMAGAVVVGRDDGMGFSELIRHGETGWLAHSPDEAAYYASRMAFEPEERNRIAEAAREWLINEGPGNAERCWRWWEELVEKGNPL